MITNIFKYACAAVVLCGLASCAKDEDKTVMKPAVIPSSVTFVMPDNVRQLIYTDETGASVLPMLKGESVTLSCVLTPDDATYKDVVWTSSNESVATVSDGLITAVNGYGYSMVQVAPVAIFSGSGINDNVKVIVSNEMKPATAVTITSSAEEVYAGEQIQLSAAITPSDATYRTVKWTSSNEEVATIDAAGTVTAKEYKDPKVKVVFTASTLDGSGVTAQKEILVRQIVQPQEVTIDQKFSVEKGYFCAINERTLTLPITTVPAESTVSLIEWTSSDETIATVDNGVVTFNTQGNFGDVTITATCPETGNSSEIHLNLAAGLVRETFHNLDHYSWYNANQSGSGTSSSHVWHDGYITVTTYTVNETTQRADLKCWDAHTWLHAGNYPIFAIRMDDVTDIGEGISSRNITIDCSGKSTGGTQYKVIGGGTNKWRHCYECSDGSRVFIYDLSTQKCSTGGLMPNDQIVDFTTMQVKYADMKSVNHQVKYNVYWIQTFKTISDLQDYIAGEGLTYTPLK